MVQHSTTVPGAPLAAYEAARQHAAIVDRSDRGRIVVSGVDRATYLQGLLTNDIAALKAGEGCYAAYLTAQGRMIADLYVYELGDVILLTMDRSVKDVVLANLDRFIFSEDVQLGDISDTFAQIAIVGPAAARIVAPMTGGSTDLETMVEHGNARREWDGQPVIVTRITDTGVAGFDVFVDAGHRESFLAALRRLDIPLLDDATADALRIEAGVPRFGRDMDQETIPLEAGIESRAISVTKGCYVGQEVIIRVLHRGHGRVVRRLVGIVFDGERVPPAGSPIQAGDRAVGEVTSSAYSPALRRPIALGYVHRDVVEPGHAVVADGSPGVVTALPLVAQP